MKDIKEYQNNNLGGLLKFKIIPVEHVSSIDIANNHVIEKPVVLNQGKYWYDVYATLGTIGYSETQKETENGSQFECVLSAVVPKDETINAHNFNTMRNQKFIIDYTDSNGMRKLVGSKEEPLFFKSEFTTKEEVAGRNQHRIIFSAITSHKAYVYDF